MEVACLILCILYLGLRVNTLCAELRDERDLNNVKEDLLSEKREYIREIRIENHNLRTELNKQKES